MHTLHVCSKNVLSGLKIASAHSTDRQHVRVYVSVSCVQNTYLYYCQLKSNNTITVHNVNNLHQ